MRLMIVVLVFASVSMAETIDMEGIAPAGGLTTENVGTPRTFGSFFTATGHGLSVPSADSSSFALRPQPPRTKYSGESCLSLSQNTPACVFIAITPRPAFDASAIAFSTTR